MNYKIIDHEIRDVVRRLNLAGFTTNSSCQGKRGFGDVALGKHCEHAFISFEDPAVLSRRRAQAKKAGLFIYNGDYSITPLSGRERTMESVFARNKGFPAKIKKMFRLG